MRSPRVVAGSQNFEDIESYESFAPLKTKGVAGGEYRCKPEPEPLVLESLVLGPWSLVLAPAAH